jgi:hypothetical protein
MQRVTPPLPPPRLAAALDSTLAREPPYRSLVSTTGLLPGNKYFTPREGLGPLLPATKRIYLLSL